MTVYVTSDTHAFHKNICSGISEWGSGASRDFDCAAKMTEHMADSINKLVMPDDTLYHLGDWSFGGRDKIPLFRSMINCKNIHLIYGNHDHNIEKNDEYKRLFSSVGHYKEKFFGKTLVVMFHYPISSWNGIGKGVNLFGHCHGTFKDCRGRQMDVGVDTNNYLPYSMDEILDKMKDIKPVLVDHHNENSNLR